MSSVEDWASQDADEEEKEALQGTDPGDGGGRLRGEELGLVVLLIDAEGVDDAPAIMNVETSKLLRSKRAYHELKKRR